MIIKVRRGADQTQVQQLTDWLKEQGLQLYFSEGDSYSIIGLVGDTSRVDIELIEALEVVESVTRIQEPYKNANRKFHPQDTIIKVGDAQIGGGTLTKSRSIIYSVLSRCRARRWDPFYRKFLCRCRWGVCSLGRRSCRPAFRRARTIC